VVCIAAEDEDPSADHCSGTALSSMDPRQPRFFKMMFETPVKWLFETPFKTLFEALFEASVEMTQPRCFRFSEGAKK
jgi:hypothetical protein